MLRYALVCSLIAAVSLTFGPPTSANVQVPGWLRNAFLCIHRYEGAWNSNTGNGYYGGLQMDWSFMRSYGNFWLRRLGTADRWPPHIQIRVAARAYYSGRGFGPWPTTRHYCGL